MRALIRAVLALLSPAKGMIGGNRSNGPEALEGSSRKGASGAQCEVAFHVPGMS
jgi:hypothetical protein